MRCCGYLQIETFFGFIMVLERLLYAMFAPSLCHKVCNLVVAAAFGIGKRK